MIKKHSKNSIKKTIESINIFLKNQENYIINILSQILEIYPTQLKRVS